MLLHNQLRLVFRIRELELLSQRLLDVLWQVGRRLQHGLHEHCGPRLMCPGGLNKHIRRCNPLVRVLPNDESADHFDRLR